MITIAIDPGNTQSALIVWDGQKIHLAELTNNAEIKATLERSCLPGTRVVCEEIASYGMAVGREVFHTCFWTGRFWEATEIRSTHFELIPRRVVKMHLCNSMKAKDSNIIQALKDRFGDKGTKAAPGLTYVLKADLWQAFALAVTAHDQYPA